ncbi:MAG: alginate export family protein, partial [Planctomycetes bacterium]|nr:alginate export family protein [Planctomycetota bacterium]
FIAGAARLARRALWDSSANDPAPWLERALRLIESQVPASAPATMPLEQQQEWSALFPRRKGLWAARGRPQPDGTRPHGLFDPETKRFQPLSPEADEFLPALKAEMRSARLIGWRPGQRAILERKGPPLQFVKVLSPAHAKRLAATLDRLAAAREQRPELPLVPSVVEVRAEDGVIVLTAVPGKPLYVSLEKGQADELPQVAQALARFHGLGPAMEAPKARAEDLGSWKDRALEGFPSLSGLITEAWESTPEASSDGQALIHADFYDKNVLVGPKGVGLVDLDGVRLGAAARDVGNFRAHLRLRAMQWKLPEKSTGDWPQHFLDAYCEASPSADVDGCNREMRRALFRLGCVYLFRRRWYDTARRLLRTTTTLLLFAVWVMALACAPFVPEHDDALERAVADAQSKARIGTGFLEKKKTVELRGRFDEDHFAAESIELEEADDEVEVKADLVMVNDESLRAGAITFWIVDDSKFLDLAGEPVDLVTLRDEIGSFCKAEGIERGGQLRLRKVQIRQREAGELDRLQGPIERVSAKRREMTIGGTSVEWSPGSPIYWDVDGEPPPPLEERDLRPRSDPRFDRILRIDDEDLRTGAGLWITDWLHAGGELQWELEWRKNHNLRQDRHRDRLIHGASAKLELSFDPHPQVFAFTQLGLGREFVVHDQERNFDFGNEFSINQAFVLLLDIPFEGLALEIGRQKFDDGREWVMDDEIDGLRVFADLGPVLAQASVSKALFDTDPEEDGVTNWLLGAHLDLIRDADLFVYGLHREGGTLVDLDRTHVGFSFEWESNGFQVWADAGWVKGTEDELRVEGHGFDLAAMYVFEDHPLEPSLYLGFAWGSGDDDLSDGKDSSFRQTGLQDNNDKFNGVTSFRYLGELVRPEVSNLKIWTAGFGFRPHRKTSVDLVFHRYEQVESADRLRNSRLRLDPLGLDSKLGWEVDVVVGLEAWEPLEMEVVLGYFHPSQAFGPTPDDAWFLTFQAEWNF